MNLTKLIWYYLKYNNLFLISYKDMSNWCYVLVQVPAQEWCEFISLQYVSLFMNVIKSLFHLRGRYGVMIHDGCVILTIVKGLKRNWKSFNTNIEVEMLYSVVVRSSRIDAPLKGLGARFVKN